MQVYLALIAALLLQLYTGQRPNRRDDGIDSILFAGSGDLGRTLGGPGAATPSPGASQKFLRLSRRGLLRTESSQGAAVAPNPFPIPVSHALGPIRAVTFCQESNRSWTKHLPRRTLLASRRTHPAHSKFSPASFHTCKYYNVAKAAAVDDAPACCLLRVVHALRGPYQIRPAGFVLTETGVPAALYLLFDKPRLPG